MKGILIKDRNIGVAQTGLGVILLVMVLGLGLLGGRSIHERCRIECWGNASREVSIEANVQVSKWESRDFRNYCENYQ
ncbi:MAG: hypothetical protein K6G65_10755, partial [Lachnospiraceae bacterium]|nr:hypothetical protein [Lachnospiraceae bacterium]